MPRNYQTSCERCGSESIVDETTTLAGNYIARLCARCRNAWDQFIRPHDLWRAKTNLEVRGAMLLALTQADGRDRTAELEQAVVDNDAIMMQLFDVAKQWIARGGDE